MTRFPPLSADSKRPAHSHRQLSALTSRLLRILVLALKPVATGLSTAEQNDLLLSAAAVLCLAKRGLMPGWLYETAAGKHLAARLYGNELQVDDTAFAQHLTRCLNPITSGDLVRNLCTALEQIIQTPELSALCAEPTLPGWLYQSMSRQPRGRILQAGDSANLQSIGQSGVQIGDVPKLTQWFTPEWICRYLVEQVLIENRQDCRFLDPACGTGHVLVAAIQRLAELTKPGNTRESLSEIIARQVFAADIDPAVTKIAAFSVYLTCRDLLAEGELPLPNIFCFEPVPSGGVESAIGSLWLGVEQKPPKLKISKFDSVMSLSQSPLLERFSAIATNPPYLGQRLLPPALGDFLKQHYHSARFDLYAAFMSMCMRVLTDGGKMGLICQQSFLSIQRYEQLRQELMQECRIESLVQLGSGAFGSVSGDKVNNAIIIAARTAAVSAEEHQIRCRRILDADQKAKAESDGIAAMPEQLYQPARSNFISGNPLSFWCPPKLSRLFSQHPALESEDSGIVCSNGLFTCDNRRFLKLHTQVAAEESHLYVPYDKGGGHKWYRVTPYKIYWGKNGEAVREFRLQRGQSVRLPGEEFYFKPGITYSYIGTKGFKARLLSPDCVFDIASSAVFSKNVELLYVLGFLNSALARFLLGVLNPTINFQIGDLRRLPFLIPQNEAVEIVAREAKAAVEAAKIVDALDPASPNCFVSPLARYGSSLDVRKAYRQYCAEMDELNEVERRCQKQIDDCVFELYKISSADRAIIQSDPWVKRSDKMLYKKLPLEKLVSDA